jgi:hypothetical protein
VLRGKLNFFLVSKDPTEVAYFSTAKWLGSKSEARREKNEVVYLFHTKASPS